MALEIFWASGSCNAWRVQLALEIKRVPWQGHLLTISKRENKTAEYLAINPRGKVPAIIEDGFALSESLAILMYLDRKYPEPPLFGRTPEEAGRVMHRVLDLINHFEPKLDRLALPIYQGKAASEAEAIKAAVAEVHQELRTLEALLERSPFLVGDNISAADCTLLPFLMQVLRAAGKPDAGALELGILPFEASYPRLAAWKQRMEALPGYDRTYPPHWRLAP